MFAQVIVDISHSEVDKIFEYSFERDSNVCVGSRVLAPFGIKTIEGIVICITEKSEYQADKIKPILSVLEETPALTNETLELSRYVSESCYCTRALSLRLFLPAEMRKGKVREQFTRFASLVEDFDLDNALASLNKSAKKQRDLLCFLSENGKTDLPFLNNEFGASAVNGALKKDLIVVTTEKKFRSPYKELDSLSEKITLTARQKQAVESVENTPKMTSLIYGVTGSGKTEVYLELISRVIKRGKTAIMLVPEISLTPQMLKQLRARFGFQAAILHSGLSAGERFDEWWRLRTGEAKIAIGARSAVFAPLENLGIIIIDEEHDGSYVSESSPRYVTSDIAKYRAEYSNAKLVLGSATPSIDTFMKSQNGEYNFAELPDRINKRPMPDVEIADMRKEVRRGNNSPFSSILKAELDLCLKNKNQAIIFLNQRGFSKSVVCAECGNVIKCQSCDVSLTYHKEDESLLCHYCGAKYRMVTACPECGSKFLRYGGYGTEKVVMELKKLYPDARILRMDRDTTQNKEGHFKILSDFANKKADILVGTQMIAKGHDFPSVTLVGILDADMSLHFSDYRSSERTFQLITQVAGRSGRADSVGKVVLQTYSPENSTLRLAIGYDYLSFYEREISVRKATKFPPFTQIVRVLVSSETEELSVESTRVIYNEINEIYQNNRDKFAFCGAMKSPLKKLQNRFRYQVLMRVFDDDRTVTDKFYKIVEKHNHGKVSVYLEINPNNLA